MHNALNTLFSFLFDMVSLPRPTERRVRSLNLKTLERLARPDGSLPYHDARVRALVWELKYYKQSHAAGLAGEYIAALLLAEAEDSIGTPLVIPIPMHPKRRRQRGHNQTEVLCEAALRHLSTGFEYAPDILERVRNTVPQQGLMRGKRMRNVKNSMRVSDPPRARGRVCIVVDDVSTTGATGCEAIRALQKAGAGEIRVIALAHS